jgi:hypothetical protein
MHIPETSLPSPYGETAAVQSEPKQRPVLAGKAAGTELGGPEQIYAGNQVRALQARVRELRQQLEKLGAGGCVSGARGRGGYCQLSTATAQN